MSDNKLLIGLGCLTILLIGGFLSFVTWHDNQIKAERPKLIEARHQFNKETLATAGEYIGTLPDGREVHLYHIVDDYGRETLVYTAGGDTTTNQFIRVGNGLQAHIERRVEYTTGPKCKP